MLSSVTQSCLTLCDPMDCSPPGSSVHGILQARILEWVAISFSRRSSQSRDRTCVSCIAGRFFTTEPPGKPQQIYRQLCNPHSQASTPSHPGTPSLQAVQFSSVQSLSRVRLFVNPWTEACQASLSITNSWSLLTLMSIELVMPSNHLILCCSLLLPPSAFPSTGVF